ncbi:hypothetical protein K488DRAFT_74304 [Vararia minispora EC-137]|uniref:Uncharacterized protein n=1 Tax=Vararia minispora EC-137 TaxID=1314806 RepID=A0ACB8Q811_9AGAM|nr:hypothetical protein K488DRAFT_74304 [Vararia minispora EC-137]
MTTPRHLSGITGSLVPIKGRECVLQSQAEKTPAIYTLPPELLSLVIIYHAINCPPGHPIFDEGSGSTQRFVRPIQRKLGWIYITHVSSCFRTIAIGESHLWRTITLTLGPQWTNIMLSRAHLQPLTLTSGDASCAWQYKPAITRTMFSFLSTPNTFARVQSIDITASRAGLRLLADHLSLPAPILESISVALPPGAPAGAWTLLPETLAHGKPCVRRVRLHGCALTWAALRFAALEHLAVTMPPPPQDGAGLIVSQLPTYTDLLDLLTLVSNNLRTLILKHCIPSEHQALRSGRVEEVDLCRLEYVDIVAPAQHCCSLLSSIIVPVSADVRIAWHWPLPEDRRHIIPWVRKTYVDKAARKHFPPTISFYYPTIEPDAPVRLYLQTPG